VNFDAIVCDIDGCLGPESHGPFDAARMAQVAAYNREAISGRRLPILTLCSGRPQPFAEALCRMVGNDVLPCVAEMGVWLYDPANNRFVLDPAITPEHRRWVREATAWIEEELVPQGVVIQPGKTASVSLWHADTPWLMSRKPILASQFASKGWNLRISNSVAWINCDLSHVSKATGITRLKAQTGLRSERLAGIGDTMGDLAIREQVAFFAVPANAEEGLKARADYVSPFADIEGVLDILTHPSIAGK
jgi:hydroxymethylpyrimidine pyrophosphatase-like HAD family hydrolase